MKEAEERARKEAETALQLKRTATRTRQSMNESGIKRVPGQSLTFIVFQDDKYSEECDGGYIWAPEYAENGKSYHSWDRLKDIRPGDVIYHCEGSEICAISVAKNSCYEWENRGAGRRIDCDYHVLTQPLSCGDYKDVIADLCTVKAPPFDSDGNINEGYLFDLDIKLAIYFMNEAVKANDELENIAEFSIMINGVPTISAMDELLRNCEVLDSYIASRKDPEYSFALGLIKRGTCFLAIESDGQYQFYPSRFVGYLDNSMSKHENNNWKDGKITNPAIANILNSGALQNTELEEEYQKYCRMLGFEPQEKGAFGVDHKFWVLKK